MLSLLTWSLRSRTHNRSHFQRAASGDARLGVLEPAGRLERLGHRALFKEVPVQDAQQLETMVLERYIEGLRDTGWCGDPDLVRNGYRIATVLRYGIGGVRMLLPILLDERLHPRAEELLGLPMSEIITRNTSLNDWLIALVPWDSMLLA